MLWDGNRQAQEYTDTHVFTTVYEQDSFEPVARLVWLKDELLKAANDEIKNAERESWEDEPKLIPNMQVYHYHNDHLGTPNELTSQDSEVVWLADYEAWGNTAKIVWREEKLEQLQVSADELQPIRFQGQSFDTETGLHYNRFRYFDPDLGMFISRDPIELFGGTNVFAYGPNPTGWIDPMGLKGAYMFETTNGTCYTGKGPWSRYLGSTRQRTNDPSDRSKTTSNTYDDAIAKGTHIETVSKCPQKTSHRDFAEMVEYKAMLILQNNVSTGKYSGCKKGFANSIASPGLLKYKTQATTCAPLKSAVDSEAARLYKAFIASKSRR